MGDGYGVRGVQAVRARCHESSVFCCAGAGNVGGNWICHGISADGIAAAVRDTGWNDYGFDFMVLLARATRAEEGVNPSW